MNLRNFAVCVASSGIFLITAEPTGTAEEVRADAGEEVSLFRPKDSQLVFPSSRSCYGFLFLESGAALTVLCHQPTVLSFPWSIITKASKVAGFGITSATAKTLKVVR